MAGRATSCTLTALTYVRYVSVSTELSAHILILPYSPAEHFSSLRSPELIRLL